MTGTVLGTPDVPALTAFRQVLADFQPQPDVRVHLDPAGHPCCLFT